jgi:hypothetical protein
MDTMTARHYVCRVETEDMNMADKVSCEVFIAMNEEGDWVVTNDESEALSKLAEEMGGYHGRVVKVTIRMAPPVMTETECDVPDEAGETKEIETEAVS